MAQIRKAGPCRVADGSARIPESIGHGQDATSQWTMVLMRYSRAEPEASRAGFEEVTGLYVRSPLATAPHASGVRERADPRKMVFDDVR